MCEININTLFGLDLESIKRAVCNISDIPPETLKMRGRKREISDTRQAFFILAKELTGISTIKIGESVKRTHSTVLHGLKNACIPDIAKIVNDARRTYYSKETCQ